MFRNLNYADAHDELRHLKQKKKKKVTLVAKQIVPFTLQEPSDGIQSIHRQSFTGEPECEDDPMKLFDTLMSLSSVQKTQKSNQSNELRNPIAIPTASLTSEDNQYDTLEDQKVQDD